MGIFLGAITAVVTAAVTVSKALAVAGLAVEGLKNVASAIMGLVKALGIVNPEHRVEELGDRAMQAEEKGMKPEGYPDYEAWVRAIEEDDWGYDPEKNKEMDVEKKVLKGVEVSSAAAIEHFPDISMQAFLCLAGKNPELFSVERMDAIGMLAVSDPDSFEQIVNFVTGAEKDHESIDAAVSTLMELEQSFQPDLTENEAYAKVASYRQVNNG